MKTWNSFKVSLLQVGLIAFLGVAGCSEPRVVETRSPPPAPAAPALGSTTSANGVVTSYTTGPAGAWNGFMLDSGRTVHFPNYVASRLRSLAAKGQNVRVTGTVVARPEGSAIEATTITNESTGQSVNVAAVAPPAVLNPAVPGVTPTPDQPAPPETSAP